MSIIRKIEEEGPAFNFTQRLENTLFHLLDDDDPVNIYMLTEICKLLGVDIAKYFPVLYKSGAYQLTILTNGDFETALKVTEALYETCIRFQKFDLAIIVNSEVTRGLLDTGLPLVWVDGRFINKS
ncbi:hypothetical protein [Mucilaginibacter jinjuensis]|uniref:Uncharacterized protein n=1 Tax=Mucilaginibacter jinjuensis TaxID=1176721 RepID=A0ABY7T8I4_9SPHI|nr:hypothetical protein [Mucilaginibacter jinjuensis]WCT11982.1 hypothetical protein PQO05_24930 [Mucilaginibacter jinjuensis]